MDNEYLLKKTQEAMDSQLEEARRVSQQSATSIVDALLEKFESVGLVDWKGERRSPAKEIKISEAEARLGMEIPGAIKDFYREMNGIENIGGALPFSIYRIEELQYGRDADPKISTSIKRIQKNYGQVVGEDVRVMKVETTMDLLEATFEDSYIASFPIIEADNFILLSSCPGHTVGLCVRNMHGLEKGYVLDFEGSTGTHYLSIKHWLANGLGW